MDISRHKIRELAFQALFAMESNGSVDSKQLFYDLTNSKEPVPEYYLTLVDGVKDNKEKLNEIISDHLAKKWSLGRIDRSSLIILQIALYEINYQSNVPDRVAVNEAVELAKQFCDEDAAKFINGVLDNCIKS